jgi:hypothetical protein
MRTKGEESSDMDYQRELSAIFRTGLTQSTVLLALGAAWLYVMMSLTYDAFYRPLGVDPGDVGLSYSTVLAHSAGLGLVVVAIPIMTIVAAEGLGWVIDWVIEWIDSRTQARRRKAIRLSVSWLLVGLAFLAFTVKVTSDSITRAEHAAAAVRQGRAVVPIGRFFTLLPLRADPVVIEPVGEAKSFPSIAAFRCDPADFLPCDRLFYLGQADEVVVLYDATTQQSIHIPASSVVLRVSNCGSKDSRDTACLNRYR